MASIKLFLLTLLSNLLLVGASEVDDVHKSLKTVKMLLKAIDEYPSQHSEESMVNIAFPLHQIVDEKKWNPNDSKHHMAIQWLTFGDDFHEEMSPKELLQRYVLSVLYFSTKGDDWKVCSRTKTSECADGTGFERFLSPRSVCHWYGIHCNKNDYITMIDLADNGLNGNLSEELMLLHDSLVFLWVHDNPLDGSLPTWLGGFDKLESLSLFRTNIKGSIPSSFENLKSLRYLRLHENDLSGTLPSNVFSQMKRLEWLWLHTNSFQGKIPDSIGLLSNLQGLSLNGISFDGQSNDFPNDICNLRQYNLRTLWINCEDENGRKGCECCTSCV